MASSTPTTDVAVLGALSVEPMNGYELRRSIRNVLGLLRLFFGRHLGADRCAPYFLTNIDLGIRACEAKLAWAETARQQLQQLAISTEK